MHAGPKRTAVLSEEEISREKQEEAKCLSLLREINSHRSRADLSDNVLPLIAEVMNLMPENYAAYNYRREVLLRVFDTTSSLDVKKKLLVSELELNNAILKKDYKCYSAFAHRHWIYEQLLQWVTLESTAAAGIHSDTEPTTSSTVLPLVQHLIKEELRQCDKLLKVDGRNFHVWNYRRWVLALSARVLALYSHSHSLFSPSSSPPSSVARTSSPMTSSLSADIASSSAVVDDSFFTLEEQNDMNFTTQKIMESFSNYSAWHQRSLILQAVIARFFHQRQQQSENAPTSSSQASFYRKMYRTLAVEIELLCKAIYCDPNDQSAWCYAPFILDVYHKLQDPLAQAYSSSSNQGLLDGCIDSLMDEFKQHDGDLINIFVSAVIDLIDEQEKQEYNDVIGGSKSSSDAEKPKGSFLSHSFLLLFFVQLLQGKICPTGCERDSPDALRNTQKDNFQRLQRFTAWINKRILEMDGDEASSQVSEENTGSNISKNVQEFNKMDACFRWLGRRLVANDASRSGMYQHLLKAARDASLRFFQQG